MLIHVATCCDKWKAFGDPGRAKLGLSWLMSPLNTETTTSPSGWVRTLRRRQPGRQRLMGGSQPRSAHFLRISSRESGPSVRMRSGGKTPRHQSARVGKPSPTAASREGRLKGALFVVMTCLYMSSQHLLGPCRQQHCLSRLCRHCPADTAPRRSIARNMECCGTCRICRNCGKCGMGSGSEFLIRQASTTTPTKSRPFSDS